MVIYGTEPSRLGMSVGVLSPRDIVMVSVPWTPSPTNSLNMFQFLTVYCYVLELCLDRLRFRVQM